MTHRKTTTASSKKRVSPRTRKALSSVSRTGKKREGVHSGEVYHFSTLTGTFQRERTLTFPVHWKYKDPVLSPYQLFIKKRPRIAQALAILLLIGLNIFNFTNVSYTQAYFTDAEAAPENRFDSGKLDIILSNTAFEGTVSNSPGDSTEFTTNVSLLTESLETHYIVRFENATGTLCADLDLEASHGTSTYTTPLPQFTSDPPTDDFGLWSFDVVLPPEAPLVFGALCEFDLVFSAWLQDFVTLPESGFYDEERLHVMLEAELQSPIVINEFLPNPEEELLDDNGDLIFDFGRDSDDMPQGEWVEPYNLTDAPVDLSGWYLTDASGGVGNTDITGINTAPATTTIAAHGFLVVYMNKPVWNNTGDTVKLLDENDVLRDSYAYTSEHDYCELVPTPGEENDEIPEAGTCANSQVPDNKSFARIPDGIGAFVDPVPTPGFVNTTEEITAEEFEEGLESVLVEDVSPVESEIPPQIIEEEQASTTQTGTESAEVLGESEASTTPDIVSPEETSTSTEEAAAEEPPKEEESKDAVEERVAEREEAEEVEEEPHDAEPSEEVPAEAEVASRTEEETEEETPSESLESPPESSPAL